MKTQMMSDLMSRRNDVYAGNKCVYMCLVPWLGFFVMYFIYIILYVLFFFYDYFVTEWYADIPSSITRRLWSGLCLYIVYGLGLGILYYMM